MANVVSVVRIQPNPSKVGTAEEKKALHSEHHSYIEGLSDQGKILMGGPIAEKPGGMLVVDLPKEECEAVMAKDPMVAAGYLKVEVSTWRISHNSENLTKLRQ